MPEPFSFGRVGVELTASTPEREGPPLSETPMRLLLLGDWAGRAGRLGPSKPGLVKWTPVPVDRDNLDEVLARFGVELRLSLGGPDDPPVTVRLAELDDFHPDRLFQRLEPFQALRQLRARLNNPATFAAAAAEMRAWAPAEAAAAGTPAKEQDVPAPSPANPEGLLGAILEETPGRLQPSGGSPGAADWQGLIQRIVEPYLLPKTDYARQAGLVALVDDAAGTLMRAVLRHPDFRAAEAAWRAVAFLTRRLETDARLGLYLLDLSRAELAADLTSADDLRSTAVYRLLVEQAAAAPWGVVVGLYTFHPSRPDAALLGRIARVAREAGAPFLAAASCGLLGCESLAETPDPEDWRQPVDREAQQAWDALRRLPEAFSVGLALPRFLLRPPYGKDTSAVESFAFEEIPGRPRPEDYLWGNPACACACLLGEAFSRHGWTLRPGASREVGGLPVHVYREDGESQVWPVAEALLPERAVEAILAQGLMPLLSARGGDAVRLARWQSLADPPTPLAGRWGAGL